MKIRFLLPLIVAVLACVTGWSAYAQSQKMSSTRPSWDYKIVAHIPGSPKIGITPEMHEDGKLISTSTTSILPKLKELGTEGWELVTVVEWSNGHRYFFKRTK